MQPAVAIKKQQKGEHNACMVPCCQNKAGHVFSCDYVKMIATVMYIIMQHCVYPVRCCASMCAVLCWGAGKAHQSDLPAPLVIQHSIAVGLGGATYSSFFSSGSLQGLCVLPLGCIAFEWVASCMHWLTL
jgi:hypothetical protein